MKIFRSVVVVARCSARSLLQLWIGRLSEFWVNFGLEDCSLTFDCAFGCKLQQKNNPWMQCCILLLWEGLVDLRFFSFVDPVASLLFEPKFPKVLYVSSSKPQKMSATWLHDDVPIFFVRVFGVECFEVLWCEVLRFWWFRGFLALQTLTPSGPIFYLFKTPENVGK